MDTTRHFDRADRSGVKLTHLHAGYSFLEYNPAMTAYVYGFRLKPKEGEPEDSQRYSSPPEYQIHYCEKPEPIAVALEFANKHSAFLNSMHVHVGLHYCQFEIEKLEENSYAIVCKSHPPPLDSMVN